MKWYSGTSGYSYKEWKGSFYPDDIGADAMLGFYAAQLPAVEINNTFYRMPKSHVLSGWASAVPPTFRFVIKATRRITHEQRLKDTADSLNYLAHKLEVLEDRLGAVLFQLPPFQRKDMERLNSFLPSVPKGLPAAIEFRHATWFDDEVLDTLAEHEVALCVSDDGELALPERVATTSWLYLRLRQPGYADEALGDWLDRASASGATTGYAFFKHEDEAAGPALAARFLELANEPVRAAKPPRRAPRSRKAIPKSRGRKAL